MNGKSWLIIGLLLIAIPVGIGAYPLDGDQYTGIVRLEGYRLGQSGQVKVRQLPPGAQLPLEDVDLRLLQQPEFKIPTADPRFSAQVVKLLGPDKDRYAIAVLDLSDASHPRYAEHRPEIRHNPGSVGKLLVALGLFQALADVWPGAINHRRKVLRESKVTADRFIISDHHKVPFWDNAGRKMHYRPLRKGDRANLYTYLDWMLSASANASASMLIREAMLIRWFGEDYLTQVSPAEVFFRETSSRERTELLKQTLHIPETRNDLNLDNLRQGGFFTREGKRLIQGTSSHATARELMRYLVFLEQGKLVDPFSSREIKRLLYQTQRRIRYASAPALKDAAVYFKSGSFYKCLSEPGFKCLKYHGNVKNLMNSVAIVESQGEAGRLYYMVVVLSNVLRQNSAVAHQTLATRIHRLLESMHKQPESSLVRGVNDK
jgi:Beta-lactamase enzyme family